MLYRSMTVASEVAAARIRLDAHRSAADGCCVACGDDAPCNQANEAAGFLAVRGLFTAEPSTVDGPRLLTTVWERLFSRP